MSMPARVTGGVDTHLEVHVVAALDERGALLGVESFETTPTGYGQLLDWLCGFGEVDLVGVEGTGAYGAGLTRHLHDKGVRVVEVDRPNRQRRRRRGKSDPQDAIKDSRLTWLEPSSTNSLSSTPSMPVAARWALELVADIERLDEQIKASVTRVSHEVNSSNTTLLEIMGCGPITAASNVSRVRNVDRFPSRDHFAAYNGTAPIEASSGEHRRRRLNPKGTRTLNRAMQIIAVCQTRHPSPGQDYYRRKMAEGKTRKVALRALKRKVSNEVWSHLVHDADRYR